MISLQTWFGIDSKHCHQFLISENKQHTPLLVVAMPIYTFRLQQLCNGQKVNGHKWQ
jgi:hypothetical protein